MQSDSNPMRDRKAAMPSARALGPENSKRARWNECAGSAPSLMTGVGESTADDSDGSGGRPGGCVESPQEG
eukprot:1327008-Pleurochrysis_carterae.AAC.1